VGDSPNPAKVVTGWGSPANHLRKSGGGSLVNPTTTDEEDFPPPPPPSTPSFFIFVAFCFKGYAKVARIYTWQCFTSLTWLFVHVANIPLVYRRQIDKRTILIKVKIMWIKSVTFENLKSVLIKW
jgi:hypothetical protein